MPKRNIPCVTVVAPVGMGASVVNFSPTGMSFEDYFGVRGREPIEKVIRFTLGVAPSLVHVKSLIAREYSNLLGTCELHPHGLPNGIRSDGNRSAKNSLDRGSVAYAPRAVHYDGYSYALKKSYTWLGYKNPIFQLKLLIFRWMSRFASGRG